MTRLTPHARIVGAVVRAWPKRRLFHRRRRTQQKPSWQRNSWRRARRSLPKMRLPTRQTRSVSLDPGVLLCWFPTCACSFCTCGGKSLASNEAVAEVFEWCNVVPAPHYIAPARATCPRHSQHLNLHVALAYSEGCPLQVVPIRQSLAVPQNRTLNVVFRATDNVVCCAGARSIPAGLSQWANRFSRLLHLLLCGKQV